MARDNRRLRSRTNQWKLLKLGLPVCKRTIQKYMRAVRSTRPRGQKWSTFLDTHAQQIWACDAPAWRLPSSSTRWQAFFMVELHSRNVIHVGVTRSPTDTWTAQQLGVATAYGAGPKYPIRDYESTCGLTFARVAKTSSIEILKTPSHAPRANAICERFLGSVRRECLDHLLILHERQLQRVLTAYVHSFNRAWPHQGIKQQIPEPKAGSEPADHTGRKVLSFPIPGGFHHDYRRSA